MRNPSTLPSPRLFARRILVGVLIVLARPPARAAQPPSPPPCAIVVARIHEPNVVWGNRIALDFDDGCPLPPTQVGDPCHDGVVEDRLDLEWSWGDTDIDAELAGTCCVDDDGIEGDALESDRVCWSPTTAGLFTTGRRPQP